MVFKLKGNDVIKEQDIEVTESLIGIYGYNNSGKTTILKELDKVIDEENIKCIVNNLLYIYVCQLGYWFVILDEFILKLMLVLTIHRENK